MTRRGFTTIPVDVQRDGKKVSFTFICKDDYEAMMFYDESIQGMDSGSLVLRMKMIRKKTKC